MVNELSERVGERHHGQPRMAYRLAERYAGRLMFVHGVGWHVWDGARWAENHGGAERAVLAVLRAALAESAGPPADKRLRDDVQRCESASGIAGVLAVASVLTPFARTVGELDADPWLLNCANGTLDLRTLTMRGHDPGDRITKITRGAYRPGESNGATWASFLARVLPDDTVRGFLQRLAGAALIGKVLEHILAILTGVGANGKGTFDKALGWTLGDYAHVAEPDLFMQAKSNPNAASPALMGLRGRRLVIVSETEQDGRLAVALAKLLTGGDPITARPLYGKPVTFDPSHTPLMITNHKPRVPGDDPALWRRLRVVPFDVVLPEAEWDLHMDERLQVDADAILAWCVDGYRDYTARGLDAPDAVREATERYHHDSDDIARFIAENCLTGEHYCVAAGDLHTRWAKWAIEEKVDPMSPRAFGMALDRLGYPADRTRTGRLRRGLGLYAEADDEPQ
jgi:putative DNA primase/helicase